MARVARIGTNHPNRGSKNMPGKMDFLCPHTAAGGQGSPGVVCSPRPALPATEWLVQAFVNTPTTASSHSLCPEGNVPAAAFQLPSRSQCRGEVSGQRRRSASTLTAGEATWSMGREVKGPPEPGRVRAGASPTHPRGPGSAPALPPACSDDHPPPPCSSCLWVRPAGGRSMGAPWQARV